MYASKNTGFKNKQTNKKKKTGLGSYNTYSNMLLMLIVFFLQILFGKSLQNV